MSNNRPTFAFIEENRRMEIRQPERLPASFSNLAAGATTSTGSYAMIRGNRAYYRQVMKMKEEIMHIQEILRQLQETALSKEKDDSMYDNKEIIEKIDEVKDKVFGIETTIARIEERTKKLDNIEQTLANLNAKIPGEIASKDFVGREINGVKNWVYATFAAAVLALLPTIISFFK